MSIKRINKNVSKSICVNQVIVTLAEAVKELLENSLDAKSDKIKIKLKNFGSDLIEVIDNGIGISQNYFSEIANGHCTSKIEDIEDLANLNTFGFRGEALNSLCALGELKIHTCTSCSTVGTLISYDSTGNILTMCPLARQKGTTVTVKRIFQNLPVRRRQLLVNLRREYDKVIQLVTSYCLICVGTQISCYRQNESNRLILSNGSSASIRNNIEAVFGSTQMKMWIDVHTEADIDEEILHEFCVVDTTFTKNITIEGCISKPQDGLGRSSIDRHFLFINGRPCDDSKIIKVITACYKYVNHTQVPMFVISVQLPQKNIDVNIEPNKRAVVFNHLPSVLAILKSSILSSFLKSGYSNDSRSLNISMNMGISPSVSSTSLSTYDNCSHNLSLVTKSCPSPLANSKRTLCNISTSTPKKIKSSTPFETISPLVCKAKAVHVRDEVKTTEVKSCTIYTHFSLKMLRESSSETTNVLSSESRLYKAKIGTDENIAEDELRRIFKKEQFLTLKVLGQFNLGFIIARSGLDIFIVDQHASDERSRFEYLLNECKLESQPLFQPLSMALGAGGEQIIMDNLLTFERIGFKFEFKESEGGHEQLYMTATCSRNGLVLGISDVLEMLELMRNTTVVNILPSKIKAAVASNACRGAIMIGRSLSRNEMTEVLKNMSNLRDPWICAHGRPTMRHLCFLDKD